MLHLCRYKDLVSLEFFIDIILPAALWPWGWVPGIYTGGKRRPVRRADNRTTFMCRLWNLGVSSSRNPQGLPRPVMGLLYLLQRPGTMVCETRLFFTGKVRYVGIVYVVSNVQQISIFRILLYILKSDTIVIVCVKHTSVLFQPLIMEVWIWSQPSVCAIYVGSGSSSSRVFRFPRISMIQQMLNSQSFLSPTVLLVYHTVSSMPGWRQLLSAVVRCAHAYQFPLQLTSQSRQILVTIYAMSVIVIGILSKDQSFKTNLGYCLGCHCAVLRGTWPQSTYTLP